ncbi:hypothetical protein H4S02_006941, partial [Coemansia sp. RSA 2611]
SQPPISPPQGPSAPGRLQRSILPNREIAGREEGSLYAQMLERKREKNKLAARRKRERKKQRLEDLEARKVELEQRRLTLRAELRARRRMNWLMNRQRHAVLDSEGEEHMPRFTPTDSSDSALSADSFSDDDDDNAGDSSGKEPAAGGSRAVRRSGPQPARATEHETALGKELDKLREDVQTACEQTRGTIKLLDEIRSEISEMLGQPSNSQEPEDRPVP